MKFEQIYLIGSLRNPEVPLIGDKLREAGHGVFDDWFAGGPIADDSWQEYEKGRGRSYSQALRGPAAVNVFNFDHDNLLNSDGAILVLPAGKSGHLELGFMAGQGKYTGVLFPEESKLKKLPEDWKWLAGLYEGEGCFTHNNSKSGRTAITLSITMKDLDVIEKVHQISGKGKVYGPYIRDNPKWSDMYRWQITNKTDALYVLRGIHDDLSIRRKEQIYKQLERMNITSDEFFDNNAPSPKAFRWDVMYQFATDVFFSVEEMIGQLDRYSSKFRS